MDSDYDSDFQDEDINLECIEQFDNKMEKLNDFYKENVETIKLKILYLNETNHLVNIKHDDLILKQPNLISNEELIKILKTNNKVMNHHYKISCMCLYNVSIEPDFIHNIKEEYYLTDINHICDIKIESTINILQDLNELLIIFKPKEKQNNAVKTKKNKIVQININNNNKNRNKFNKTRKNTS